MRRNLFVTVLLAALIALPATSDARPRIFGAIGGFFGGIFGIGHHHFYHHHHHAIARRERERETAPTEQASPAQSEPSPNQQAAPNEQAAPNQQAAREPPADQREQGLPTAMQPPANLSSLPIADFAAIEDDFFGDVIAPISSDAKFWAHGERDMIQAVFAKDTAFKCSQSGADRAAPLIAHITQATQPTEAQHPALEALQAALAAAFDRINATCRNVAPITPSARLKSMQERLFAIRNAGLSLRAPLSTFYDQLTDTQKTQFNSEETAQLSDTASASAAPSGAQICVAQAQAAYAWPAALIGRRVRPNQQQRASLEALQKTLFGMAIYLNGACPKEATTTPVARLDAAMHRLDAMVYAVIAVSPAVDDFYSQLSDEQKARFNAIDQAAS
jgi:hypothetical protein